MLPIRAWIDLRGPGRDDLDLQKNLSAWKKFYNQDRPHGAQKGKTPYEALREKLR